MVIMPQLYAQLEAFVVRLAAHVSNGWKSLIRPSSGKDTDEDKGVHREVESEGSRMANLCSDGQKSVQVVVPKKSMKVDGGKDLTVGKGQTLSIWYLKIAVARMRLLIWG